MTEPKRGFAYSTESVIANFRDQFPEDVSHDPTFISRMETCLSYAQQLTLLDDSEALAESEGSSGMEPWPISPEDYLKIIASPSERSKIGYVYKIPPEPRDLPGFRTFTIAQIFALQPRDVEFAAWLNSARDSDVLRDILHTALTNDIAELENQKFHLRWLIKAKRIEIPNRADGYQMLLFQHGRDLVEFYTRMKANITQLGVISLDILRF